MTVIEELMATFRVQQHTIETLTLKLEETNATLAETKARIVGLEEQLHKDSHNSSKLPSSDGYEKPAPKSQSQKSGKKQAARQTPGGSYDAWCPRSYQAVHPQHCLNCPHRAHCDILKAHDSCYAVDVEIRKVPSNTRSWSVITAAYRKSQSVLFVSADLLHTEIA